MRRIPYIAAITTLIFMPSVCLSSFLIELKNGSEYITELYWKSGDDIEFRYYGGIVSLPENSILAITKSDKPYYEIDPSTSEGSGSGMPSGQPGSAAATDKDKNSRKEPDEGLDQEVDIQGYKKRNSQLRTQLGSSLTSLRDASRDRDETNKPRARKEVIEYSRQIYDLADELRERNGGVLPEDWWEGIDKL
jgi:hypothetical protein